MDRRKNKIVAFRISKNDDKIDSAVCRGLLNDVIYNNNSNYKLKNKIKTEASFKRHASVFISYLSLLFK